MQLRLLSSDEELAAYAEAFRVTVVERSKGRARGIVPIAYLRTCVVRALFDEDGKMRAGYAIGRVAPLRLLDFVPEEDRALLAPPGGSWDRCSEIVCMWKRPDVSAHTMATRVWPSVIRDAVLAGKPFVLGHNENESLDGHYARPGMSTLYAGPSVYGLQSRLFAYTRLRLAATLVFGLLAVLTRRRARPQIAAAT